MWATRDVYYNSMKWHIADPNSVVQYETQNSWGSKVLVKKTRVDIICAQDERKRFTLGEAKIRDKINIYQNNVCAYCRNKILKDEGIESRLLK